MISRAPNTPPLKMPTDYQKPNSPKAIPLAKRAGYVAISLCEMISR
ncbi:MAG: hypothetical protein U1A77_14600 [Pirellulales bacterium]